MSDVLLIEDDDMQRAVAGLALRKAGHAVREVADGPEGLASARDLEPDVIVCDVMMPGMSGYELLAELRQDPGLATVPVILLTAMSDRQDMRKGMTAGADDYLTKPYRPEECARPWRPCWRAARCRSRPSAARSRAWWSRRWNSRRRRWAASTKGTCNARSMPDGIRPRRPPTCSIRMPWC
ncbi:response regulator transcription factor [Ramlibacter montanisoli]|uniref:Response regulator n=1 Tax=Ramlibacter montanisoli TaxID=2732512 RepID=A0A849KAN6_9BURK|nr:response regulator [Ramlibacter montanisoli]NNU42566.1 response regulator [Ramlibacter montanisoli]